MSQPVVWTAEQKTAIARAYFLDGDSASTIGARFGVTRNAIIGLAHRNRARAGVGPARKLERVILPKPVKMTSDARRQLARQAPQCRHVKLVDLAPHECRFPVTPDSAPPDAIRFCGLPADGLNSYCPHHRRLAYARPAANPDQET